MKIYKIISIIIIVAFLCPPDLSVVRAGPEAGWAGTYYLRPVAKAEKTSAPFARAENPVSDEIKLLDAIAEGGPLPQDARLILEGKVEPVWGVTYNELIRQAIATHLIEGKGYSREDYPKCMDALNVLIGISEKCMMNSCDVEKGSDDWKFLEGLIPFHNLTEEELKARARMLRSSDFVASLTEHQRELARRFWQVSSRMYYEVSYREKRRGKEYNLDFNDLFCDALHASGIISETDRTEFSFNRAAADLLGKAYYFIRTNDKVQALGKYAGALRLYPEDKQAGIKDRIIRELDKLSRCGYNEIVSEVIAELGLSPVATAVLGEVEPSPSQLGAAV